MPKIKNLKLFLAQNRIFLLTNDRNLNYIRTALAKSNVEPENSNDKTLANSTPQACFFIRSIRTPQARQRRHSMVAYSGKGFALCCVPMFAVSQPVIRYRPEPENFQAVTSLANIGVTKMIYQFLGVSRQHYDPTQAEQIRILAESENQARAYLARDYVLILLGRLPNSAKNDRTLVIKGGVYA